MKDSDKAYAILHEQSNLGSERSQNLISCYRLKEITGLNAENKEEYIEKVITEIATFNNPSRLMILHTKIYGMNYLCNSQQNTKFEQSRSN
ncbi:hypothetical protein DW946_05450 [Bacteroides caccae]|nr:hypothetical protein DW946_05450 [Bacteroides caccae]